MTSILTPRGVDTTHVHAQETNQNEKAPITTTIEVESSSSTDDESESTSPWLIVSPYTEHEHQLDLRTVDTPFRLLALALVKLEIATTDYATVSYEDAFKWSQLMSELKALAELEGFQWTRQEFYVVEFRSKLKENIDRPLLFALDKHSHVEATASGGLLKYWYGEPDSQRRNLATCESEFQKRNDDHD